MVVYIIQNKVSLLYEFYFVFLLWVNILANHDSSSAFCLNQIINTVTIVSWIFILCFKFVILFNILLINFYIPNTLAKY